MRDLWCPNCGQRVAPLVFVTRRPVVVSLLTLAALSAGFSLLFWLTTWLWPNTANTSIDLWAFVALVLVLVLVPLGVRRWLVPRSLILRCPMCRTLNLTPDPPIPT